VEFETRRIDVRPVDAVKNARRARRRRTVEAAPLHPAFDPPKALLDKATGRRVEKGGES
jgi:hypothetical protein